MKCEECKYCSEVSGSKFCRINFELCLAIGEYLKLDFADDYINFDNFINGEEECFFKEGEKKKLFDLLKEYRDARFFAKLFLESKKTEAFDIFIQQLCAGKRVQSMIDSGYEILLLLQKIIKREIGKELCPYNKKELEEKYREFDDEITAKVYCYFEKEETEELFRKNKEFIPLIGKKEREEIEKTFRDYIDFSSCHIKDAEILAIRKKGRKENMMRTVKDSKWYIEITYFYNDCGKTIVKTMDMIDMTIGCDYSNLELGVRYTPKQLGIN